MKNEFLTILINQQMMACNPNMERDNIRYESPKYVKLTKEAVIPTSDVVFTKKAVIPTSDVVLNQSSPSYNWFEWD